MTVPTNDLQATTHALIDTLTAQIASADLRYIAVSVRLDGYSIDFRVAPTTATDKTSESHDEAVDEDRLVARVTNILVERMTR